VTWDKEEKMFRDALTRQRAAEIMELALSDPSTASAGRRARCAKPGAEGL
jgi:hypothetical protein